MAAQHHTDEAGAAGPRARGGPCQRTRALAPLCPQPRPGRPRGARAAQHGVRETPRAALPRRQRVPRRPAPGRQRRPPQCRRSIRPRPGHPLHRLRLADDPRRAETAFPRPGLDGTRAARPPRPDGRRRQSDHRADQGAPALALGRPDRRAPRARDDRRARGAGGKPQPPAAVTRPAGRRRRHRGSGARGVDRRPRTRDSSWSRAGSRSTRHSPTSTSASGWSCGCASSTT